MNKFTKPTKDTSPLASSVLKRLETEKVVPASKWKFRCLECSVWMLWALTVTIGAVAVAVMIFVGDHARFALYEATHETPLSFAVEILPYIWIGVFTLMALLAYINLRKTKRGYRYPVSQVLLSSVIFSIAGGVILHIFGTGALIDAQLGDRMKMYQSMEKKEMELWQTPSEGRLIGTFQGMDTTDTLYVFSDRGGKMWQIETLELRERDKQLLTSGRMVRVLGTTTDQMSARFYACGVFPWMYDKKTSKADMDTERKVFVERMYDHMETYDRLESLEERTYGEQVDMPFTRGICGEIATMKRMRFDKM